MHTIHRCVGSLSMWLTIGDQFASRPANDSLGSSSSSIGRKLWVFICELQTILIAALIQSNIDASLKAPNVTISYYNSRIFSRFYRSEQPLALGRWHTIKISRTARLAVLKVTHTQKSIHQTLPSPIHPSHSTVPCIPQINQLPEVMTISPNGFWHLSLPHSVYLGGVQNIQSLPQSIREHGSFAGCIQKVNTYIPGIVIVRRQ